MRRRKVVSLALCLVMAVGAMQTGATYGLFKGISKVEAKEMPEDPKRNEETGEVEYDYVNFGSYPQTELTADEITDAIKNAEYDDEGNATVDGVRYRRMNKYNATYYQSGSGTQSEEFYYWKDAKTYHYFRYEPIKWRVLKNEGDTLLLMAANALDCQKYSTANERFTWATSPMRTWLNAYDGDYNAIHTDFSDTGFIRYAFTQEELDAIAVSSLHTADNDVCGIDGGEDVQDKVFLLSAEEASNAEYGFNADYSVPDSARLITPTEYAFAMGAWLGTYNDVNYGNCWWMLRTPGSYGRNMSLIYRNGVVYLEGYQVTTPYYGVTPAIRVDASSDLWKIVEDDVPTTPPTSTPIPCDPFPVNRLYGDVTDDGDVDLDDVNEILKFALTIKQPTNDEQLIRSNVDGKEGINLDDVNLVLKYALTIITRFPIQDISTEPTATPVCVTEQPTATPIYETAAPATTAPVPAVTPAPASGRIWIAADSIAAKHTNDNSKVRDTIGWGVIFNDYLSDDVKVFDTALSSRSAKSFSTEQSYKYMFNGTTDQDSIIINGVTQNTAVEGMKPGDYLLISFGHNDEYPDIARNTDPYGDSSTKGSYKWFLKTYYIDPVISVGATPVLISSVVKRNFVNGELCPQFHELYATAMKELSEEYAQMGIKVGYIDLHHKMQALYQELGDETTKLLHAAYMSDGVLTMDNVHFTYAGAKYATKYILEGLKELDLDINQFRDEDAISTLDTIELTETFDETTLGK